MMTSTRMFCFVTLIGSMVLVGSVHASSTFNGHAEYQTDRFGYYYILTGGLFPTGPVPNGDSSTGGTVRFITDDPYWGYAIDTWHKRDWWSQTSGFALTLKNGPGIVYNNNGIEDGTYGNYYNAPAQGLPSNVTPGLYRVHSMSNNADLIYAGYFKIETSTTFDQIIGYFDEYHGFDSDNPGIGYRMNIWSNVAGDLLPVNTGSFTGDVFSSDNVAGAFTWGDTGVDRVYGPDQGNITYDTQYLKYTLDTPITLDPGVYWFSHDAVLVPAPGAMLLAGLGAGLAGWLRRRRML